MSAAPACPNCGHDFDAAGRITDGRFAWSPSLGFTVDGVRLEVAPRRHAILELVMRAAGACVSAQTLIERLAGGYPSGEKAVHVHMAHIRDAFHRLRVHCPIETVYGRGYRWNLDAPQLVTRPRLVP